MSFDPASFELKLSQITPLPKSICSISQWAIIHKKHCLEIVNIWYKYLCNCPQEQKLVLIYLLNDIAQNSRRRGTEFIDAFSPVLVPACTYAYGQLDQKGRRSLNHTVNVWKERSVFQDSLLDEITASFALIDSEKADVSKSVRLMSALTNSANLEKRVAEAEKAAKDVRLEIFVKDDMAQLGLELDDSVPLVQDTVESLNLSIQGHKFLIDVLTNILSETKTTLAQEESRFAELSQLLSHTDDVKIKMKMIYDSLPEALDDPSDSPQQQQQQQQQQPPSQPSEELRDPRIEAVKRPAEFDKVELTGDYQWKESENTLGMPPQAQKARLNDNPRDMTNFSGLVSNSFAIQQQQQQPQINGFGSFTGQQNSNQPQVSSYQQPSLPGF